MKVKREDLQGYLELLNETYTKLPRDVPNLLMEVVGKYAVGFVFLKQGKSDNKRASGERVVGGVSVVKLSNHVFGIHDFSIGKEFRGRGLGKKLMDKVHRAYKGIFLTKTRSARGFYERLGYKYVGFDDMMIYCNKKGVLTRRMF